MSDIFGGKSTDTHCKHPLKGFPVGLTDNGNTSYKITSYDVDYVAYKKFENGSKAISCHKGDVVHVPGYIEISNFIEVPCGHCMSCRLRKSKEWANRMLLEAQEHESNYFLTLTYNDLHLPEPNVICDDDAVVIGESPIHPLVLRDIQLFMKKLRKEFPDQKIRYYACGEYGSKNMRPHYHLILFGLKLPDDDLFEPDPDFSRVSNELGDKYYWSHTIEKLWCEPYKTPYLVKSDGSDYDRWHPVGALGIHNISNVTWETCAYTARYVTKKLYGDEAFIYEELNFPKEFAVMSRRPGIGYDYYERNKEMIFETDELFLNLGDKGGKKVKPPKYYDRLFDIDYPDAMNIIKLKRADLQKESQKLRDRSTTRDYLDQLSTEEHSLLQRTKVLKRERSF